MTIRKPELDWEPIAINGIQAEIWRRENTIIACRAVQTQFACLHLSQNPMPPEQPDPPDQAAELVKDTMRRLRLAPDLTDRSMWFEAETSLPS